jgi:small redox-active disulfide protein 2
MKKLQVLGTGCPRCRKLAENAAAAADVLGIEYELVRVTGVGEIAKTGVMMTPALIVDGEVRVVGKVPDAAAIKDLLQEPRRGRRPSGGRP